MTAPHDAQGISALLLPLPGERHYLLLHGCSDRLSRRRPDPGTSEPPDIAELISAKRWQ